ncbi:OmpA family protein (plasmid) [Sphingomonas sp. NY01]|uniref:OmpA family protein n=1 Tax=Sphingomonas sp. NY01 TaxID=2968057 RepID=UPI00315E0103
MTLYRATFAAALALALAACGSPRREAPEAEAVESPAAPDPTTGNSAATSSIMRPAVAAEQAPKATPTPVAEPLTAVVPFADRGMTLEDAGRAALDTLVADPAFTSGGAIVLRGHTDSRGSDADNRAVARGRAEAVRAYLVGKGADRARITLVALGEARPVAPNAMLDGSDDPEGRRRNRRVEVEVAPPPLTS